MDRRSSQRVQILGDFRVYDHLAEQYLGVIVDASLGGQRFTYVPGIIIEDTTQY